MFDFTFDNRQAIKVICDADYSHNSIVARKITNLCDMHDFYRQAVVNDALCLMSQVHKRGQH